MSIDQRRSPRVEFFLVPEAHEPLPAWVVDPVATAGRLGGVVVNLSENGVQVLTAAEPALDGERYELRLLLGEGDGIPLFNVGVRRVWSKPLSRIAQLCGFEFEAANSDAEEFLRVQTMQVKSRQWVRCLLVERVAAQA